MSFYKGFCRNDKSPVKRFNKSLDTKTRVEKYHRGFHDIINQNK